MKTLYWDTIGTGTVNLIFLHGWSFNSTIWFNIIQELIPLVKIYLIDIPGMGKNKHLDPMKIEDIVEILHIYMPKKAIWLGWSIGGLIASKLAILYPNDILGIITVASSPCFIAQKNWPGIQIHVLRELYKNLKNNYYTTISQFLNIQIIGVSDAILDVFILKKILSSQNPPNKKILKNGLKILCNVDLRLDITFLKIPFLRIYGSLDNLVPKKIIKILDHQWPQTQSITIKNAVHAPFISHKKEFCSILYKFIKQF